MNAPTAALCAPRSALTRRLPVLVAVLVLTVPGCGSGKQIPVRGVVKLDGKPVAAAIVEFLPQGGQGQHANGVTDSDGTFHLGSHSQGDGAWPGDYKVIVIKSEVDPAMLKPFDPSDPQAEQKRYKTATEVMRKPKKFLIPAVYRDPSTTPLTWKVPNDNNKTLELTSSGGR